MKSYAAHRKSYYFIDLHYALKATNIKIKSKNKYGRGAFFSGGVLKSHCPLPHCNKVHKVQIKAEFNHFK